MALPLALAQRLQKRGILPKNANQEKQQKEQLEEVIAEDYDCDRFDHKSRIAVNGCPNKYNIYHECSLYCQKRWSNVSEEPSPKTKRKYQRLLKRYPLPEGWQEVYDPGVRCFYYWNTQSDEVSWLPPHHPNARISLSADKLRALMRDDDEEQVDDEDMDGEESDSNSEMSDNSDDTDSDTSDKNSKKNNKKQISVRDWERDRRAKGRTVRKTNDLDPMDPSAYSDIPRGKWSDGLEKKGDAKTGVDSTVSGPLFQMRPYPSPGSVLRLNANKTRKEGIDED